jgi:hypothetical protein
LPSSFISYDWLVTETEAWPLSSRPAYRLGAVRLTQAGSGYLTTETRELAGELEEWLRPRARGMTLEVLRQIRDDAWFANADREVPLATYLIRLARRYLEPQGDRLCLKQNEGSDASERAARWRWLSFLIPEDLLIAAVSAAEGCEPLGEQVHLLTPHLERVLSEQELAETHLHVGAAVPFTRLWTALLIGLAEDPPGIEDLDRSGPPPFGAGKAFLGKLLAAAIMRLLMASFLDQRERRYGSGFEPFCYGPADGLARLSRRLAWHEWTPPGQETGAVVHGELVRTLAHLGWKDGPPDLPTWQALYRKLWAAPLGGGWQAASEEVSGQDALAGWLGTPTGGALPETRFAARAVGYLVREGKGDQLFERIYWQSQRVRCMTFRHLVEEPGTGGLDWFSRHYQRIGALRKGLDETIYRCALESECVSVRLSALEARTAPPHTWPEVYKEIQRLAKQTIAFSRDKGRKAPDEWPEVALIFHFIKEREDHGTQRLYADPRSEGVFGCRFGRWFYSRLRQAFALECALERDPEVLLLLRGLDVANFELAVPTWACLPLFERVRRASFRAAEKLSRRQPEWHVSALRVTCHLGEDFVRLVQGLRRIHEPFEFGLLTAGSRIGHAVALGLDPAEWASASATLPQTAQERLEDLLWELDRYGRGDIPPSATGRPEYIRHQVARLSRRIYGSACSLDDLLQARRRLHSPRVLEALGYPYVRQPEEFLQEKDGSFELLWRYLTDSNVFERGQETIEVLVDDQEIAFLRCAQQWLRRWLGRNEITVESNPSSNLLIGGFRSLDDHPAFRLLPLASSRENGDGPMMLSLNVDDPITFASHLANEYAHIYFALTRRGVSSQEALAWLCQVREHGWRSRFTLSASRQEENLRRFWAPSHADRQIRRQGGA